MSKVKVRARVARGIMALATFALPTACSEIQLTAHAIKQFQRNLVSDDATKTAKAPQYQSPADGAYDFQMSGIATWNGDYSTDGMTATHPTLPVPSWARVTNAANGRSALVKIVGRPKNSGSTLQVSRDAADALGFLRTGLAKVEIAAVNTQTAELLASKEPGGATAIQTSNSPAPDSPASADRYAGIYGSVYHPPPTEPTQPAVKMADARPADADGVYRGDARYSTANGTMGGGDYRSPADARPSVVAAPAPAAAKSPIPISTPALAAAKTPPIAAPASSEARAPAHGVFIQVGSFRDQGNARQLVTRLRDDGFKTAFSEEAEVAGKLYHRVRIGPLTDSAQESLALQRAQTLSHSDARVIRR